MLQVLIRESFKCPPPAPVLPAFVQCGKCGGSGKFTGYTGRVLGDCFACKGAGKMANPARAQALAPVVSDDATTAKVTHLIADPMAAIKSTGLEVGNCAVCGLELTDPDSISRGIGPICSERLS